MLAGIALAASCSSVPIVHYADDGGSSGTPDGSSGDGAPDTGSSSGQPDWSCPDKPPPSGSGSVCCGNRLCFKCTDSDCSKCDQAGCGGSMSDGCCRKNQVQLMCKAYTEC